MPGMRRFGSSLAKIRSLRFQVAGRTVTTNQAIAKQLLRNKSLNDLLMCISVSLSSPTFNSTYGCMFLCK